MGFGPFESAVHNVDVGVRASHDIDALLDDCGELRRVAHNHADRQVASKQALHYLMPNAPGWCSHNNHATLLVPVRNRLTTFGAPAGLRHHPKEGYLGRPRKVEISSELRTIAGMTFAL